MSYGYPQDPQQQGQAPGYAPTGSYSPPGYPPQGYPQGYGGYVPPAVPKHSGIGIASLLLGLLTVLALCGAFAGVAYLQATEPALLENDEEDPRIIAVGLTFIAALFLALLGVGLGLGALLQGTRKKLFGILGLVLNGLILLLTVGLIVLGLAMEG